MVIGRICKEVLVSRVREVIFGYTVANDVTARDLQKTDGQWARAKGYDTFVRSVRGSPPINASRRLPPSQFELRWMVSRVRTAIPAT